MTIPNDPGGWISPRGRAKGRQWRDRAAPGCELENRTEIARAPILGRPIQAAAAIDRQGAVWHISCAVAKRRQYVDRVTARGQLINHALVRAAAVRCDAVQVPPLSHLTGAGIHKLFERRQYGDRAAAGDDSKIVPLLADPPNSVVP